MLFCPNIEKGGKAFEVSIVLLLKKIFETKPKLSGDTCYFGFTTLLLPFIFSTDKSQPPFSMKTTTEADAPKLTLQGIKLWPGGHCPFVGPDSRSFHDLFFLRWCSHLLRHVTWSGFFLYAEDVNLPPSSYLLIIRKE